MKKIAHLTSVHSSRDVRIFYKECISLKSAGYNVSLIAPNEKDETNQNVQIYSIIKHGIRFRRFFSGSIQVLRRAYESGATICHFHDPELIPIAAFLALTGKKIIYDVHEDLPRQILSKPWIASWLLTPVSKFAALAEWCGSRLFFSAVVAATPTIAKRFPDSKTVLVQNFPIRVELCSSSSVEYTDRPENIIYIGGISKHRGVVENIKAFDFVRHKNSRYVLAGSFLDENLENECRDLSAWSSVDFKGFLSREGVRSILDSARIGVVLLHPRLNYLESLPIKLFEYMSAGIPVIASDFPLWRSIIEGANCGLLVDPMKPEEIAEAIDWLLDHPDEAEEMGKNGRQAVIDQYNWSHEEKKLLALYEKLA